MRKLFIFCLIVGLGIWNAACSPVMTLNQFAAYNTRPAANIPYAPGERHMLSIYLPSAIHPDMPVLFFIYGGKWLQGDRQDYAFVAKTFTDRGMVVVIPDYRLHPAGRYPAFLNDNAAALRWTYENIGKYGGDPSRIFLMGHSAGAYNAAMLTLNPQYLMEVGGSPAEWVHAFIGIAGPYDFLPLTDPELMDIFGKDGDLTPTQPITYADHPAPPMFLATGDEDETVIPRNTNRLAAALKDMGSEVQVKTYSGIGHVGILLELADLPFRDTTLIEDVTAFVKNH